MALARSSAKTVTEVARDLGASPERLRNWVKQDETRPSPGGGRVDRRRTRRPSLPAPAQPRTADQGLYGDRLCLTSGGNET
ncbi:transposase [Kitasatospora sp. NBC_00070]|uniref:transposase n=1 Tax=Kitasatospora sp. NBC_00070 TaxID=2975962 RepID=UPI0038602FEF